MENYGPYRLQTLDAVTVPYEIREKLGIKRGDLVFWIIDDEGRCILKKAKISIE